MNSGALPRVQPEAQAVTDPPMSCGLGNVKERGN